MHLLQGKRRSSFLLPWIVDVKRAGTDGTVIVAVGVILVVVGTTGIIFLGCIGIKPGVDSCTCLWRLRSLLSANPLPQYGHLKIDKN